METDGRDQSGERSVRDAVCGMEITPTQAVRTIQHDGRTFYFCSEQCARQFQADPERYAAPEQAEPALTTPSGTLPFLEAGRPGARQPVPSVTTGVPEGAEIVSVEFPIEQLDCLACAQRVQSALGLLMGVRWAFVNPDTRRATVVYDRRQTSLLRMVEAVRQAGYAVGTAVERMGIAGMT